MKKAFRFFLAAMMASALFLGCSTDGDDSGDDDDGGVKQAKTEFLSKLPGVYTITNTKSENTRDDGVAYAIKISESDGTYTLECWDSYTKNDTGLYSIETETFTKESIHIYATSSDSYKGFFAFNKKKNGNEEIIGFIDNDTLSYKDYIYKYTRRDSSFDFYAGTEKESSSSGGSGSSSGSLPSNFDITTSTWTYTGTAGNASITYTVKFGSDGNVAVKKSETEQASGTWSLSGTKLTLKVSNKSGTTASDTFTLSSSGSTLTLTLSGESSYTTNGSTSTTSDYSMALTVMFMSSSKTATLTASN